jgi:dTDP-4-amino-4,6-dideoxygalactose transaminase
MITTDDERVASAVRLLRSHGMTTLTWDRHRGHAHSYDVVAPGFNFRLDEVRAAIGLVQLSRLERENAARAHLASLYRKRLGDHPDVVVPFGGRRADVECAHHLAVVLLPDVGARDRVREALHEHRIQTSVHYPPIHRFSYYRPLATREMARTDAVGDRLVTLPLYGGLGEDEVGLVADVVLEALQTA